MSKEEIRARMKYLRGEIKKLTVKRNILRDKQRPFKLELYKLRDKLKDE